MKQLNTKLLMIFLAVFIFGTVNVDAQNLNRRKVNNVKKANKRKNPVKNTAKFLNKTNKIMKATRRKVKADKVYTGYLRKAKTHQKAAIALFKDKKFAKAVKQSYKARRLSFLAYRANNGTVKQNWRLNKKEKRMVRRAFKKKVPKDKEFNKVTDDELKGDEDDVKKLEDPELENVIEKEAIKSDDNK